VTNQRYNVSCYQGVYDFIENNAKFVYITLFVVAGVEFLGALFGILYVFSPLFSF
jgi:hypothetical protein